METPKFNDSRPILFQFDNGCLNEEKKGYIDIKYLRSKTSQSNKRMLVADTGNLKYTGPVIQKQSSYMKYYIGVVDKQTKTIEQIEQCLHCTLKPKITSNENQEESKLSDKNYRQKTDILVESFGSSKQKRLVSARKRNEEVNSTVSDKVSNIVNTIIDKSPPAFLTEKKKTPEPIKEEFIAPPLNNYALQVKDMYKLADIITNQIYEAVRPHAQEIIDGDNVKVKKILEESKFSEYVSHHLRCLPSSASEREKRATYLCYLDYMMKFYMIHPRSIDKKDGCPHVPLDIQYFLHGQFTQRADNGKRFVPKKYKDKLLCYILVLSLILENYEMTCNLLVKDLKIGVGKLTKILRSIGCSVKNPRKRKAEDDNDAPLSVIASLQLPKGIQVTPTKPTNIKGAPASEKKKAPSSTSKAFAKKIKLEPPP